MKEEESNVQQIRFSNGTEVLANIIKWEDDEFIEANCILEIERRSLDMDFEVEEGTSFYVLKPWVSYIDDMYKMTSINPVSIVSVTVPSPVVSAQYVSSLCEIIEYMDGVSNDDEDSAKPDIEVVNSNVLRFTPKKSIQLLTED